MVLELINVTKNFGKFQLGHLSLTVNNKDVMVILELEDLVGIFQLGPLSLI